MSATKREQVFTKWDGDEVKKRAEKLAAKSSFEIGLIVQAQAKLLVPRQTGRLGASITTRSGFGQETKPSGKGAVGTDTIDKPSDPFETFVGTPVDYGPYMEYGTVKTSAQPFLRPALDIARGRALTVVQAGARKEFAEYLTTRQLFSQTNEAFSE
jgi:HK97 gp10 family phage protein